MPQRSLALWMQVVRSLLSRMDDGKNLNYVQIHSYILEQHYSGDMNASTVAIVLRLVREHMQRTHKLCDIDACVTFTGDSVVVKHNP